MPPVFRRSTSRYEPNRCSIDSMLGEGRWLSQPLQSFRGRN